MCQFDRFRKRLEIIYRLPRPLLLSLPSAEAKLLLLNPGQHPRERQYRRYEHGPEPDVQYALVEVRLSRGRHRGECQRQKHISAHAVVFVHGLCARQAAEDAWRVELGDTDQGLDDEERISDQAEDRMRRLEMRSTVRDLVVFDDDQSGDEAEDAGCVQGTVDVGALFLLFRGMCGLEDQDGFGCEE